MSFQLGAAWVKDDSAKLGNWFCNDFEKILSEVDMLNPAGGRQARRASFAPAAATAPRPPSRWLLLLLLLLLLARCRVGPSPASTKPPLFGCLPSLAGGVTGRGVP